MNERVTDLEVKVAFQERHIAELDEVVRVAVDQIRRLEKEFFELQRQMNTREGGNDLKDEEPPHYGKL